MRRHRSRRRNGFLTVAAVAAVAVCLLGWWLVSNPGGDQGPDTSSRPTAPTPEVSAEATPYVQPDPPEEPATSGPSEPVSALAPPPAENTVPGMLGSGYQLDVPPLDLVITVTSSSPIGTIGWVIPTSRDRSSGTLRGVGRSWTLRTEVYGNPDYARVFLQAGATGDSITCRISVEGKVTEERSTVGPYGATMCQG